MAHPLNIRKRITLIEILDEEAGRPLARPLTIATAGAVLKNPWAGQGFVEDLRPAILEIAPPLGKLLTDQLAAALGGADALEAYGKAAVVGLDGELEHASALIHTLRFGNVFRERVGGTAYLPFTNRRAAAGSLVAIPLVDKVDAGRRSHYLTADLTVADAPRADELLVAISGATGGRPFARIGDRYEDEAEMGLKPA